MAQTHGIHLDIVGNHKYMKILCSYCKKNIKNNNYNKKYCDHECRRNHLKDIRADNQGRKGLPILSTGTMGAMSELQVSIDLMNRGYEVYRALSPASSSDILAIKNGKIFDIEVRTGILGLNGRMSYPKTNIRANYVAVYMRKNNEIYYFPELI